MTSTDGLVAALARAQSKFPPIVKSHTNPAFKGSQYADVADVLAAVRPVLAAEGIVVIQMTRIGDEGGVALVTTLAFGEQVMQSEFPLYVAGLTAQQVGSLLTYHRRYQLCALLGVHPVGDDDDGNLAATAQTAAPKAEQMPTVMVPADWKTRPLAQMTFQELRAVAFELNHPFSGGSKSELIRQLEPLVRAASGEEPWPVEGEGDSVGRSFAQGVTPGPPRPESEAMPFQPVLAKKQADAVKRGGSDG